jgi:hypothetical protein
MAPKTRVTFSGQFDVRSAGKPLKYGVGLDVKY